MNNTELYVDKEITLQWSPSIKEYYGNKGYTYTKFGDYFTVKIEDFNPNSAIKVSVKCEDCGKVFKREFRETINKPLKCQSCLHKKKAVCECCGSEEKPRRKYENMMLCPKCHYIAKRKGGILITQENEIVTKDEYSEIVLRDAYGTEIGRAKIDTEDIEKVKKYKWRLSSGYVKSTINDIGLSRVIMNCNDIYGIFKYAKEKEYIDWSILQTIGDIEIPRKTFRKVIKEDDEEVFTDEEIRKLINYLISNPTITNLGIIIMFCTGVRVGELVGICWEDVIGNSIKIRRTEISYKKKTGGNIYEIREYPKTEAGIRTVYIPSEFTNVLEKLRDLTGDKKYMLSYENGDNIKTLKVRKQLYTVCDKIGIKKKSPHKLRKTYISILLDNGVDNRLIQDVVGHTEISTSEKNYHRNRKSDEKKEEILSNLPEFKNAKLMF